MATLNELMKNEEFIKGLVDATTPAELGELFAKNDIQLEEGLSIEEAFEIVKNQENAELSEEALEDVNGGIGLMVAAGAVACLVVGAGMLCFLGGYAYQKAKSWRK